MSLKKPHVWLCIAILVLMPFLVIKAAEKEEVEQTVWRLALQRTHDLEVISNMRFYRHPNAKARDLCVGYAYEDTGNADSTTSRVMMIAVECEKVKELIINR